MGSMHQWLLAEAEARQRSGIVRRADRPAPSSVELLDLASNDYLGLATDPRLAAAAVAMIEQVGTSARASRVVTGTLDAHVELEEALCSLTGQPAALVFSSGYTANLAVLTSLGGPDTLLLTDEHIHASLIDAARLARGVVEIVPHRDLAALEAALVRRSSERAIVVVESIYSVFGDATDLEATAALCERHDALLVVDEAHGIGVVGGGRGGVHAAGLAGAEHVIITATMSKALGSQGGAVLGSALLREQLINSARTFIFDTGLAPASAAAASAACRIIEAEPELVEAVARNAAIIAEECEIARADGSVQSIPLSSPEAAVRITAALRQEGVLVGCFRPPSVPDGISRIRITASAALDAPRALEAARLVATCVAKDKASFEPG
jgi:8-amino-7-oxononanoate synthase